MTNCFFCGNESRRINNAGLIKFDCVHCGLYLISYELEMDLVNAEVKMKIAGVLRERNLKHNSNPQPIAILTERNEFSRTEEGFPIVSINEILQDYPKTISERLNRILFNLTRKSDFPGFSLHITVADKALFFPQSNNNAEVLFLMQQLINQNLLSGTTSFPTNLTVTIDGWNKVVDLENSQSINSNQAFVAMWFNEEMNIPYDMGIRRAISDTNFTPVRIDQVEHNNKIDDEIIAEIKKSKFVVSDFTGHRGGVYFEAGYAMGLGIPVIWTCRQDDLENLHFDTRQYSHIVWENQEDLYEKLYNRIRATIL